jgi:4-hydroxythreonine-4-phosphate dehydrogenase
MAGIPLPRIAVTLGDPAGVGPETIVGAWSQPMLHECCLPFVVGHPQILRRAVSLLKSEARVVEIDSPGQANPAIDAIPCLRAGSDEALEVAPGVVDARGGQAAFDALTVAARAALAGEIDGLTTAPLHKAALWKAGHEYPGHTELLAELCGVDDFAMMLYLGPGQGVRGKAGLSIVHVTLHMALADAVAALNEEAILRKTRLVADVAAQFKGSPARIAVCALNPHAGEDGLFGGEEQAIIRPAVDRARAEGIDAIGPLPADTLIARAAAGEFDAVVAMYHDQGHIAIKLLAMHRAVNVTLGLPIVRTSVAHGTAFDLAWQGRAETSGLVEALRVAARLSHARYSRDQRGA